MKTIESFGGPVISIDRASLSQWCYVLHSSFFGDGSNFENYYEEMCDQLDKLTSTHLSTLKGANAEAVLIDLPLPTFIVEADGASVHLVQIWSCERGWSMSCLTMDDFRNTIDWMEGVEFFCGGGDFLIFDSSCPHEDIEEHFSVFLEKGTYKCESCDQRREGEAEIMLIRMLQQASR